MSVNDSDIELTAVNNTTSDRSSSGFTGSAQTNTRESRVDLSSNAVNEEDIDPFTYHPPFTKWDYLKVRQYDHTINIKTMQSLMLISKELFTNFVLSCLLD